MATPYAEQFATAYLAVGGGHPFGEDDAINYLAPMLRAGGFSSAQYPSIEALAVNAELDEYGGAVVQGGPFDGVDVSEDTKYITALKWNLRNRAQTKVTREMLGAVRAEWRATRRELASDGYPVISWSLQPYGAPLSGDHGVPSTPALPGRPSPTVVIDPKRSDAGKKPFPWGLVAAGVVGLITVANLGK